MLSVVISDASQKDGKDNVDARVFWLPLANGKNF